MLSGGYTLKPNMLEHLPQGRNNQELNSVGEGEAGNVGGFGSSSSTNNYTQQNNQNNQNDNTKNNQNPQPPILSSSNIHQDPAIRQIIHAGSIIHQQSDSMSSTQPTLANIINNNDSTANVTPTLLGDANISVNAPEFQSGFGNNIEQQQQVGNNMFNNNVQQPNVQFQFSNNNSMLGSGQNLSLSKVSGDIQYDDENSITQMTNIGANAGNLNLFNNESSQQTSVINNSVPVGPNMGGNNFSGNNVGVPTNNMMQQMPFQNNFNNQSNFNNVLQQQQNTSTNSNMPVQPQNLQNADPKHAGFNNNENSNPILGMQMPSAQDGANGQVQMQMRSGQSSQENMGNMKQKNQQHQGFGLNPMQQMEMATKQSAQAIEKSQEESKPDNTNSDAISSQNNAGACPASDMVLEGSWYEESKCVRPKSDCSARIARGSDASDQGLGVGTSLKSAMMHEFAEVGREHLGRGPTFHVSSTKHEDGDAITLQFRQALESDVMKGFGGRPVHSGNIGSLKLYQKLLPEHLILGNRNEQALLTLRDMDGRSDDVKHEGDDYWEIDQQFESV